MTQLADTLSLLNQSKEQVKANRVEARKLRDLARQATVEANAQAQENRRVMLEAAQLALRENKFGQRDSCFTTSQYDYRKLRTYFNYENLSDTEKVWVDAANAYQQALQAFVEAKSGLLSEYRRIPMQQQNIQVELKMDKLDRLI